MNLLGEHTDYNGGPVLPIAISRRTTVVAAPDDRWRFASASEAAPASTDPDAPFQGHWTDYLSGVVRELRALGAAPAGARLTVSSTIPIGAGLSSSAALTVAGAAGLAALARKRLPNAQLADVAYRAEHDQVGVHCGRMDQAAAVHCRVGHALLFETGSGEMRQVPFPWRICVVETGISRRLADGALNERRRECEDALATLRARWPTLSMLAAIDRADLAAAEAALDELRFRRVRHVVSETARTRAAAAALEAGDLPALGSLMVEGQVSLARDYESSIPEADFIVDAAMAAGAYGARLTGAGWGGAVLVLAAEGAETRILRAVIARFRGEFGREPTTWRSRAAGGVRVYSSNDPAPGWRNW